MGVARPTAEAAVRPNRPNPPGRPSRAAADRVRAAAHPRGLWPRPPAGAGSEPALLLPPSLDRGADGPPPKVLVDLLDDRVWSVPGPDPADGLPWADRRLADRRPVRPGSRAEVRRWGAPADPDMADELLDVCEAGVGIRVCTPVRPGQRLNVTLWGPGAVWCGRGLGIVRWAVIGEGRAVIVGVQLSRRLTAQALRDLSVPPPEPDRTPHVPQPFAPELW